MLVCCENYTRTEKKILTNFDLKQTLKNVDCWFHMIVLRNPHLRSQQIIQIDDGCGMIYGLTAEKLELRL